MNKCKLGDILDVKRGASLSGKFYANNGEKKRLTLGNFDYPSGGFKENDSKENIYFIGEVKEDFILKKGDIITPLTEQTPGLLGETARIPTDNEYVQSGDIGLVIPNEQYLDKSFAYYLVSSPMVKKQLSAGAQQTKIRHTSPEKIKQCVVWIPDLNYQHYVGKLLDSFNFLIENNIRINTELESLAKTIYDYWFLQFDFPNKEGKPYKSSGGAMVWNEDLKMEIPEGWEVTTLGQIIVEQPKSTIQVGQVGEEGTVPFFTSGDNVLKASTHIVSGENCFLNTGGNAGIKYYSGNASYSTDTWCIRGKNDLTNYLYLYLKSIEFSFDRIYFAGSGLRHLQKPLLKAKTLVIPPKGLLNDFNKIIQPVFALVSENIRQDQELINLRDFLLPLLMNGQVVFKD